MDEGAILHIHDPKVNTAQITTDLSKDPICKNSKEGKVNYSEGSWLFKDNIYEACAGTDAVVVLTEWGNYACMIGKSSKPNEKTFMGF